MASIELLKIILQPIFQLDDGFDLDAGFETASYRQTEQSFEIFRYFLEIKNQDSIVYLQPRA